MIIYPDRIRKNIYNHEINFQISLYAGQWGQLN